MVLGFIFAHANALTLAVWVVFFSIVLVRFLRPHWGKNISYKWLIAGAVALHLLYATFITWGQYHIWSTSSDFTRALLTAPLPVEAPLPAVLEWTRPYFDGSLGYFAYYAFGRFFLSIIMLFAVTGIFYAILNLWNNHRRILEFMGFIFGFGYFLKLFIFFGQIIFNIITQFFVAGLLLYAIIKLWDFYQKKIEAKNPEMFFLLMLIAGWPGIVVLGPLGFAVAILFSVGALVFLKKTQTSLLPAFLVVTPIALIAAKPILNFLNLYPLLKI